MTSNDLIRQSEETIFLKNYFCLNWKRHIFFNVDDALMFFALYSNTYLVMCLSNPTLFSGWRAKKLRVDPWVGPHPKLWTRNQR